MSKPRAQLSERGTHPSQFSHPSCNRIRSPGQEKGCRVAPRGCAGSRVPLQKFRSNLFHFKVPASNIGRREKVTTRPSRIYPHAHSHTQNGEWSTYGVDAACHPFADSNSVRHVCPSRQVARRPAHHPRRPFVMRMCMYKVSQKSCILEILRDNKPLLGYIDVLRAMISERRFKTRSWQTGLDVMFPLCRVVSCRVRRTLEDFIQSRPAIQNEARIAITIKE